MLATASATHCAGSAPHGGALRFAFGMLALAALTAAYCSRDFWKTNTSTAFGQTSDFWAGISNY